MTSKADLWSPHVPAHMGTVFLSSSLCLSVSPCLSVPVSRSLSVCTDFNLNSFWQQVLIKVGGNYSFTKVLLRAQASGLVLWSKDSEMKKKMHLLDTLRASKPSRLKVRKNQEKRIRGMRHHDQPSKLRVYCVTHYITLQLPWRDFSLAFFLFSFFLKLYLGGVLQGQIRRQRKWMGLRCVMWKTQRIN